MDLNGLEHKPQIRAITSFARIDRVHLHSQMLDVVRFLHRARRAFQENGYKVQTLRATIQSFVEYTEQSSRDLATLLLAIEEIAHQQGITISIGSVMQSDTDETRLVDLFADVLAESKHLAGSVNLTGDTSIHTNAVRAAARAIKFLGQHSPKGQANFSFAGTAMLSAYCPFYPGSYSAGNHQFSIALESANVVCNALFPGQSFDLARRRLEEHLNKAVTSVEVFANTIANQTSWSFAGIDVSPAPGDHASIGAAIEMLSGAVFGSPGTLSAAAMITNVVRRIPVKRVGYSGLMMPILEDQTLAERWADGRLSIDALLAYSAVCGTGLDTVPLPGDVSEHQIAKIVNDVATLALTLRKPLSVRLLPVAGKSPGERTQFDDPRLINTVLQPLP